MSTVLTSVFGSEINVAWQPRDIARQFTGFPGARGLTCMHLGSRGYAVIVTGRVRAGGESYAVARANLVTAIANIEDYLYAAAEDYTYFNETYQQVVWGRLELIPGSNGKVFHWNIKGEVFADFRCIGRALI